VAPPGWAHGGGQAMMTELPAVPLAFGPGWAGLAHGGGQDEDPQGGGQEYGAAPPSGWAQGGGQAIMAEFVAAPPPFGPGWAGAAQGGGQGAGRPSAVAYIGQGCGQASGADWPAESVVVEHGGGQAVAGLAPLPV
jgi:hypothetical protein